MALNKGKQFEEKFKIDWNNSFPKTFFLRLYDNTSGFTNVVTPCDFLAYNQGKLYMLECKSHEGTSIAFSAIPQYERMLPYKDMEGVCPFIIVWFRDKDKVIAVPIKEAEKMRNDGNKSINIKMLTEDKYKIIEIPSVKKRVFMDSDYRILSEFTDKI